MVAVAQNRTLYMLFVYKKMFFRNSFLPKPDSTIITTVTSIYDIKLLFHTLYFFIHTNLFYGTRHLYKFCVNPA